MSEDRHLKKTGVALFSVLALMLVAGTGSVGNFVQNAYAANTLTVNGISLDGKSLNMWTTISTGGSTVKTGFTPLTYTGITGTNYTINVSNYGNYTFDHWQDGSTANPRTVTLNSDITASAYFKTTSTTTTSPTTTHNLTVNAYSSSGSTLGMYTTISSGGGTVVKTGFTPLTYAGTAGATYTVSVSNYGSYTFDHWQDGSTANPRTVTLSSDVTTTAFYNAPPPPNKPPVALNDTATTDQGKPVTINVLANDSDPDGDTLSITSVKAPAHGSATINTGANNNSTITYTSALKFSGEDSFAYTISDGKGGTATATVSVQVKFVNYAPVASDQSVSTNEDTSLPINLGATDANGDSLVFSIVAQPMHGSIVQGSGNNVTYSPSLHYYGQDSFTFKANDGRVDSNIATVSMTVLHVNHNPVANNDVATTNQDTSIIVNVLANDSDVDGDVLKVISTTIPAHGTTNVSADGTTVTYKPAPGYYGTDSFGYTISDGNGGTATATVTITVKFVTSTYTLAVNSSDMYGKAANGLYTVISKGGNTVKTGFTPFVFTGSAGATYSVTISDYGSTLFDHWQDSGSTTRAKSVTLSANTTIVGVFRVPTVVLSPTSGISGTTITVSGTYFTPNNSAITITYDGQSISSSSTTTTDAAGAFTATFNTPALGTGFHTVTATDAKAWKASAKFQDTTPPPPHPLAYMFPKTGVYVALYMYPSGDGAAQWQQVYDQKVAHPSVPIVATFNPNSGAGTSKDPTVASWVAKLKSVHVIMIGYTYDSYGTRSLTDLKTEASNYKNWYNADGLFIDEFTNTIGYETHYSSITSYAKSIGMNMTMGNPGTDVPKSYVGTVDVLNITEGAGYMPISWLQYCVQCSADQGWHYQYDKRYFAYTRYNITSLDTTFETNSATWVGLLYITDGNDSNGRWFALPSYFGTLVATLDK